MTLAEALFVGEAMIDDLPKRCQDALRILLAAARSRPPENKAAVRVEAQATPPAAPTPATR